MALPERRHFDIESAAEYLGCSVSDLRYFLDEGMLRLAFPTTELWAVDTIAHEELSQSIQDAINRLPDPPDRSDLEKIKRKGRDVAHCPEFLYISGYHRKTALESVNESGRTIYHFEKFNGQHVNIWLDGSLISLSLDPREDGELNDTILPREELDRLKRETETEIEPELKPEAVSDDATKKVWRFRLPNQADDIAIAIVDYGNRYIKEKKGHRPTLKDLQGYMLLVGRDSLQLKYDSKGKDYIFGDKPLSERAFRTRYKNYLKSE